MGGNPVDSPCPRCGASTGTSRFCPSCGAALEAFVRGQILDEKYEVLGRIGAGGMGEVYRVRHIHLDEIRIIKVTKPEASGSSVEPRRFQEEARLAALVRHPNVAALHDFSRRPDGTFYMVWEFIDGVTLQHRLRKGPLTLDQTIEISLQVLAGLEAIHEQGIVHRDLSPDNIMIREASGGRLQAKIIDLGIAKRLTAESRHMTSTGIFLGKVKYGSPEQAGSLPAGQKIDARSDIYSFGVVLYEMLTGKAPFEAETPHEYLGKHLHQAPPPLDLVRLPAAVGPAIAAVVKKALEKNRERRFQSARELADALRVLVPASPADRPGPDDETVASDSRPAASSRKTLVPTLAAIAALAAVGGVWLVSHRQKTPGPTKAFGATGIGGPAATLAPSSSPSAPAATPTSPPPLAAAAAVETATLKPSLSRSSTHRATGSTTPSPGAPPTTTSTPVVLDEPLTARRPRLEHWRSRPIEERARTAQQLARWANKAVSQRPEAPELESFRKEVAALLRSETLGALDQKRPRLAAAFYKAYLSLDFAPADPELARRMSELPQRRFMPP